MNFNDIDILNDEELFNFVDGLGIPDFEDFKVFIRNSDLDFLSKRTLILRLNKHFYNISDDF